MSNHELPPLFLLFSVIILNIPAICVGTSIAWTSYLIDLLKSDKTPLKQTISSIQTGYISAMLPIGATYGAIVAAIAEDKIGRKKALILLSGHAFFGYAMAPIYNRIWIICVSRILTGSLWGACFVIIPSYVAEIASIDNRGMLCAFTTIATATGKFLIFTFGNKLSLISMSFLRLTLLILFFTFVMPVVPPSPYYLVAQNKEKAAKKSLKKFRHKTTTDIEEEFEEMRQFVVTSFAEEHGIIQFVTSKFLMKRLGLLSGIIAIQQLSGYNVLMLYMTLILKSSPEAFPLPLSADIVAAVQLITPFLAPLLVDAYGRRKLLLTSTLCSFVSLTVFGTTLILISKRGLSHWLMWIPVVTLIIFMAAYNLGLGPILFVLLGEFFPPNAKAAGCASTIIVSNIFILVITFAVPQVTASIGVGATFLIFGFWCLVGSVFVHFCLPESARMTLGEIHGSIS